MERPNTNLTSVFAPSRDSPEVAREDAVPKVQVSQLMAIQVEMEATVASLGAADAAEVDNDEWEGALPCAGKTRKSDVETRCVEHRRPC